MVIEFFRDIDDADVRIHGNGFLQAELPDGKKMHVWNKDPDFPRQAVNTQIHNHVSSFRSAIIYGKLRNIEYRMKPLDDDIKRAGGRFFDEYEARVRHGKDTGLHPTGRDFGIDTRRKFDFSVGSVYDFPGTADLFHETIPQTSLLITVIERRSENDPNRNPIIMVPLGQEPDNVFDRYAHKEYAIDLYGQIIDFLNK